MELNDLDVIILNKIQNATKLKPIQLKTLSILTNLPYRKIKKIITKLRKEYAIVSKETLGGGYWIAENNQDIYNFIGMIEARKQGYEDTINKMLKFIK